MHQDIHLLLSFAKFEDEEDFEKYITRTACYKKKVLTITQFKINKVAYSVNPLEELGGRSPSFQLKKDGDFA